jgi:hypothetical protein
MRERLGKALVLLQATPLPADLIDNPARTSQWLTALGNLHQAVTTLRAAEPRNARGESPETRGERVMRNFNQMIEGLPLACLNGISPVIKLGLLRPLLIDLEAVERRIIGLALPDLSAFTARLTQYRTATAGMAARHVAPDPPALSAGSGGR